MEQNKIRILASILTYNGGEKTIKTISNIVSQESEGLQIEIVVIDNGSTNDIIKKIKILFPEIPIIENRVNLGFSGGNNKAIELALKINTDFLFVLNDDIQVPSNYIKEMAQEGIKLKDSAVLGSIIALPNGKIQAVCGAINPLIAGIVWNNVPEHVPNQKSKKVDAIQGAAFVLTKIALNKGFRFDESLFFGGEEYDLAYWAKSVSLKIYVMQSILVVHHTNQIEQIQNRWHISPIINYYAIRNNLYIKHKYSKSHIEYFLAVSFTISKTVTKGILFVFKGDLKMLKILLKGIKDGINKNMGPITI